MVHSYNKNQEDALFLNFILVKNSTCHTSCVDGLLANRQHN